MEHYKFFTNRECEYFPCHKTEKPEEFNCLFCYCPLYSLGSDCGGDYLYTPGGIKNCVNCTKPHERDGYEYVRSRIGEVIQQTSRKE